MSQDANDDNDDNVFSSYECVFECNGSVWVLISGNPPPGYTCQPPSGNCSPSALGQRVAYPPILE